jgi:hypothetical protein
MYQFTLKNTTTSSWGTDILHGAIGNVKHRKVFYLNMTHWSVGMIHNELNTFLLKFFIVNKATLYTS